MTRPIPRPAPEQAPPTMLRLNDVVALTQISASTLMRAVEDGEFWAQVAAAVDVIGDCNNPLGAAAALCAREGVEMIEQD